MKVISKRLLSLLLSATMLLSAAVIPTPAAEQNYDIQPVSLETESRDVRFNEDWKFYLGSSSSAQNKTFDDSAWETVSIPHDFSISQDFTTSGGTEAESGFLPGGTGWYRKHFTVDADDKDKTFVLSFDGAYENAYVYVNGTYVGENHYGYNSFAFDITDYLTCDGATDNVVAVKVVHELPSSRWYSGSGIYRDVTLTVTNPIHVAMNGTYITTPNLESEQNGNVTVNVNTDVQNDSSASTSVTVRNTMLNSNGEAVSDAVSTQATITANASATVSSVLTVNSPELWSIETPVLYELKTEVLVDGNVVDTYYTDFGFRYFRFDANYGFYLNGEAVKIKGVCLHHDQGALGAAAYDDAMERQLLIMKDMGCNAVRTSHNIADEDFIRLCNEHGILVMEEAFDGWSANKNDNTHDFSEYFNATISSSNNIIDGVSGQKWAEFTLKSMVKRDRNDPSIIMWDIGNEIMNTSGNTSSYVTYAGNMIEWIQSLDTTRPITHGDNKGLVTTSSTHVTAQIDRLLANSGGVVGFNYWAENIPTVHRYYPNWKLISTETVSSLNTRGGYTGYTENYGADSSSSGPYICNAYDNYCVSWGCTAHDGWYNVIKNDCNAGEFIWTGFDYIGEPNPWWSSGTGAVTSLGAAPNSSSFGAVDTAGFPKDKYYFYRSQWNENDTTLHLVTAWDADNQYLSSRRTPVWIYTNAAKVELYRTDSNGNTIKLATATRKEYTTTAGHSYGTYTSTINNSSYCQKISTSGATALSARFNVTYTDGSIYAIAYDENGNVINETVGNSRVNTPGNVAKIDAYADKTEIAADGYSLSYITIDVTDSNDNLDTAATNTIQLTLTGEGEIVGVDNGNPATTKKFQQKSVLTSDKTANIDAYAGKALVIVRSTEEAGGFTLTASSNGLSGDEVTVNTVKTEVEPEEPEVPDVPDILIPVTSVTLNQNQLDLEVGESFELTATVVPEDATNKEVTWTSSNAEIATVENGYVTAIASGTVVITAEAGDCMAECTVVVTEAPPVITRVMLDHSNLSLKVGEKATLLATVLSDKPDAVVVEWKSSDESVATVNGNITADVTAVGEGVATITATAGDLSATCLVTVTEVSDKIAPTVSLDVEYVNKKIVVTGQSDIGVNPDLYYTEIKHGILYITTSFLGSKNLTVTTAAVKNIVLTDYEDDGTFSYTFKPLTSSMSYAYRAYVYYERPDGSRGYAYSPIIKGAARSFVN